MDPDFLEEISLLLRSVSLTEEEKLELESNYPDYSEMIQQLLLEIKANNRIQGELNRLRGESASLNYETYETYMALHTSAVRLGGTLSSVKMAGLAVDHNMKEDIERILKRYIILD